MNTNNSSLPPDISVSIVSYNTRDFLRDCLRALQARVAEGEVTLEIIVIDNDSRDGSAEMVEAEFPEVRLKRAGSNLGYGRANNRALEDASGRYFFVLNSDTEVEAGALRAMRDFLDETPAAGAVGAQLILPDGEIQPSCATDPKLSAVFWEQTYLDRLFPNNRITGGYSMTHWDYRDRREVEQVAGACLFVRREAWRAVGGFDPVYFMYFEDTDLCVRLRKAGWQIWFLPDARILHHLGGSSQDWRLRARMIASYNQSRYHYFSRYEGPQRGQWVKSMVMLGALLRLGAWSLLALVRPSALEKVRLFRRVLRATTAMQTLSPPEG